MEYVVWYKHLHVDLIILVLNNTMQTLHLKAKLAVLCGWHANWGQLFICAIIIASDTYFKYLGSACVKEHIGCWGAINELTFFLSF